MSSFGMYELFTNTRWGSYWSCNLLVLQSLFISLFVHCCTLWQPSQPLVSKFSPTLKPSFRFANIGTYTYIALNTCFFSKCLCPLSFLLQMTFLEAVCFVLLCCLGHLAFCCCFVLITCVNYSFRSLSCGKTVEDVYSRERCSTGCTTFQSIVISLRKSEFMSQNCRGGWFVLYFRTAEYINPESLKYLMLVDMRAESCLTLYGAQLC